MEQGPRVVRAIRGKLYLPTPPLFERPNHATHVMHIGLYCDLYLPLQKFLNFSNILKIYFLTYLASQTERWHPPSALNSRTGSGNILTVPTTENNARPKFHAAMALLNLDFSLFFIQSFSRAIKAR